MLWRSCGPCGDESGVVLEGLRGKGQVHLVPLMGNAEDLSPLLPGRIAERRCCEVHNFGISGLICRLCLCRREVGFLVSLAIIHTMLCPGIRVLMVGRTAFVSKRVALDRRG